jgi:Uma2 family endonuclease
MLTDVKFPITNDDLADLVDADGYYSFPASFDEYWHLVAEAQYRADYYDHQVITSMSYESDIHSRIAGRFNTLLNNIFDYKPGFVVYNSNRPVYIEDCDKSKTGVFNADGMVVALPRQPYQYSKGLSAETTPILLIEILSPSTAVYDFGTKLPCYKQIPSVQTILFVKQDKPEVIVMERQAPNQWHETTLTTASEAFLVADSPISLQQIYREVYF